MKKTSHITHKHKRRKPIPGLTPDDVVRQMTEEARGGSMRKVRGDSSRQKSKVLPAGREGGSRDSGEQRVFATAPRDDAKRPGDSGTAAVSDAPGKPEPQSQFSKILKRILGQTPPAELLDTEDVGQVATNAEALAAVVMREALAGKQWAVEMVRDQTEGKPVRAAQINNGDGEIEDMLDRVSTARLNQIAKGQ